MLTLTKEVMYVDTFDASGTFFLAADIGGTNSNFGIFALQAERPLLVASVHFASKDIQDFTVFFKDVLTYILNRYAIHFTAACIGAAGVVYPHRVYARPTNLPVEINTNDLRKISGIETVFLINDFEAVALGVELLNPKDIISVHQGVRREHGNVAFVGAGTGLGKGVMVWNRYIHRYLPVSSEGGHSDASFYSQTECAFAQNVASAQQGFPASWENILSGAGIKAIYAFLGTIKPYPETDISREIALHDFNPDRISFYAKRDERCRDTFDLYTRFYARCAKNFALDSLALNGIYIAGGIAAKNISLFFEPQFIEEFVRCAKQHTMLSTIPIYLIADYNVSLYGAAVAYLLRKKELL